MPIKLNWIEYKKTLELIHNNKYDYSKVIWNGVDEKINVICPYHGEFLMRPAYHKKGRGCQICSKESKVQYNKLDSEQFIENSIKTWDDLYDYSKVNYIDALNKALKHLMNSQVYLSQGNASLELFAEELRLAQDELGEITGKLLPDDLLGKIFSSFCIGK